MTPPPASIARSMLAVLEVTPSYGPALLIAVVLSGRLGRRRHTRARPACRFIEPTRVSVKLMESARLVNPPSGRAYDSLHDRAPPRQRTSRPPPGTPRPRRHPASRGRGEGVGRLDDDRPPRPRRPRSRGSRAAGARRSGRSDLAATFRGSSRHPLGGEGRDRPQGP